jgi:SAM-dependent methyltransferase
MKTKRILELGCGRRKALGAIGVDFNLDATAADLIADISQPLPFRNDAFDEIRAVHLIEHVEDVMKTVGEMHRVAKPGGLIYIVTPHYTDFISWCDPTHRWHLNTFSFRYFGPIHGERHWYTRLELRERKLHVELARLWKYLGLQWLVNRFL